MLRIITPAEADPVSLTEAKAYLRVDHSDEDDLITSLIKSATLQAQALTQRLFVEQTVELILPCWPDAIRLPVAPVRATDGIVSVKYVDENDVLQTLSSSLYVVRQDGATASIFPTWDNVWPTLSITPAAEPIVVRFIAGQPIDLSPALESVPENVKTAIKMLAAQWYANRETIAAGVSVQTLPYGFEALLASEVWN